MDAGTGARILLVIVYIVIIAIVGFVIYRWWSKKFRDEEEVFAPEQILLDRPPEV